MEEEKIKIIDQESEGASYKAPLFMGKYGSRKALIFVKKKERGVYMSKGKNPYSVLMSVYKNDRAKYVKMAI